MEGDRQTEATYISDELVSKFLPVKLYQLPKTFKDLWVFWSQQEGVSSSEAAIQNKIINALCSVEVDADFDGLIQFWAPRTTMMGDHFLTTDQQPFAIKILNEELVHYKKQCRRRRNTFVVPGGDGDRDGDSMICCVFRNQLPEVCKTLSECISKKKNLQRDLELRCDITDTLAFPLFETSQQSCVGVLEFLFSRKSVISFNKMEELFTNLERAGLVTLFPSKILKQNPEQTIYLKEEIDVVLRQVSQAHGVSLASAWVRCNYLTSADVVVARPKFFSVDYPVPHDYCLNFRFLVMRIGKGLIGNAFLSDKPFLCTDLTELSISHYPIEDTEYSGCITICLQNNVTGKRDHVLMFHLRRYEIHGKDFDDYLSSMLETLKYHLHSFKIVGGDPGDKLFIKIDKLSAETIFESLKTQPCDITRIGSEALQNEGEIQVQHANFPGHSWTKEAFTNRRDDSIGSEQRQKAIVPKEDGLGKKSKWQYHKESSCSYQTLKLHFGKKLEDVADSLGVSRSTVKRWCRENNIIKWPHPKRSKCTSLAPTSKKISESDQVNAEPLSDSTRKGLSSSGVPMAPDKPVNTAMVKATYKNDTIKFQLCSSSRMIDLVAKVILRLKLSEGTFSIKYLDEDGDYILVSCDEDLEECINSFRISGKTTIKMLIEPLAITIAK